jgi:chromosome segregation ATPase
MSKRAFAVVAALSTATALMIGVSAFSRALAASGGPQPAAGQSAAASGQSQATSAPSQADILPALVAEVRQLRVALERAAAMNATLQLAGQRANIQEERLWRVSREVETLRTELRRATEEVGGDATRLKHLEEALAGSMDPEMRKAIEQELPELKRRADRNKQREGELRQREIVLLQALQSEEARWGELNQRLDDLERLLSDRKPQ